MEEIRCFATRNILEGEARGYRVRFVCGKDFCVVLAMGDGPAEMDDFIWIRWDKLRMILPDSHEILLIGYHGQWDRPKGSFRWIRAK